MILTSRVARLLVPILAAGIMQFVVLPARGADIAEAGRAKAKDAGDAVVTLKIVAGLKYSMGGREGEENEVKTEARGTIIDDTGMTICALSEIDPAQLIQKMYGSRMGNEMKIESNLKDLKIILANQKEIPATVVLRDNDLDIAIVRPLEKQTEKIPCINLKDAGDAKILEPVFVIGRMGQIGNRQLRLATGEIESIITKPRKFFVPGDALSRSGTGVPAFTADGKVLGLLVTKSVGASADVSPTSREESVLAIILPASDILEIAAQAPEKAPPTPTPEASKDKAGKEEPKATEEKQPKETEKPSAEKPSGEKPMAGDKETKSQ